MATFTLKSASNAGIYTKLVVLEQAQSIADNTTTLKWELYMWNTSTTWYSMSSRNAFLVQINGTNVYDVSEYGMVSLQNGQSETSAKLIASGTTTVAHDADGSKSCALYFRAWNRWNEPPIYVWTASETVNLTMIARASQPTLSASSLALGDSVVIKTNRASSAFTHTLKWSCGSGSGEIATGIGDSYSWTVPKDLAYNFTSAQNASVTISCLTYNNSALIGTKVAHLTVKITSDMVPTLACNVEEATSGIADQFGGYVKGKSKLKVTLTANGAYGSAIAQTSITANAQESQKNPFTTNVLAESGQTYVDATVTDSRLIMAAQSVPVSVIDYSNPSLSISAERIKYWQGPSFCDVKITYAVAPVNNKNTRKMVIKYKKVQDSVWTTGDSSLADWSGTFTHSFVADETSSYDIQVELSDWFMTTTATGTCSSAPALMSFSADGTGMAIGKIAENSDLLDVELPMRVRDKLTINGKKDYELRRIFDEGNLGCVHFGENQGTTNDGWFKVAEVTTQNHWDATLNLLVTDTYGGNAGLGILRCHVRDNGNNTFSVTFFWLVKQGDNMLNEYFLISYSPPSKRATLCVRSSHPYQCYSIQVLTNTDRTGAVNPPWVINTRQVTGMVGGTFTPPSTDYKAYPTG